jgi:hypothetical protein
MSIAFDSFGEGYANANSLTFSHTCNGSDRFLHLVIKFYGTDDLLAVTYNGDAMSLVGSQISPELTYLKSFTLMNPDNGGPHNIVITRTSTNHIIGTTASYTGVSQTGQPEANAFAAGSQSIIVPSVIVVTNNAWVVGGAIVNGTGSGFVSNAGSTLRRDNTALAVGYCAVYDRNADMSPGAQLLSMTTSAGPVNYAGVALSIAPTGGVIPGPVEPSAGSGLLSIGPSVILTQNVIYALPSKLCRVITSASLEVSIDQVTWNSLISGQVTGSVFIRCTTGNATVKCERI